MNEKVLLFHMEDPEMLSKIRVALMIQKITVKVVAVSDYNQTVGYLAGISGTPAKAGTYTGEDFDEPMMIFCMPSARLDGVLAAFRKAGIPAGIYKAMLTPTNSGWTPVALMAELKRERAEILKQQRKK